MPAGFVFVEVTDTADIFGYKVNLFPPCTPELFGALLEGNTIDVPDKMRQEIAIAAEFAGSLTPANKGEAKEDSAALAAAVALSDADERARAEAAEAEERARAEEQEGARAEAEERARAEAEE
eukprot:1700822-Amphidinium_carterae.1